VKKLLIATAFAAISVAPAVAADMAVKAAALPARPACAAAQWNGGYVGINGGSAYHSAYRQEFGNILSAGADEGNTVTSWGGAVGGQIGYNFVQCSTFWGIEVDGSWLSNDRFVRTNPLSTTSLGGISSRLDGVVTLRGRAGVALDNLLLYVTGGAAALHTRTQYSDIFTGGTEFATVTDWTWGWVAGFGTEYAVAPNLSFRTEFLYIGTIDKDYRLNSVGVDTGVPFTNPQAFTHHDNVAIARVGLNYRWGAPVVARY
jgi:outer membrane immunogenic protein